MCCPSFSSELRLPRRRSVLLGLGAILAGGASPLPHPGTDQPFCASATRPQGGDRQGKFDATGTPLFWPGNTIICPFGEADPLARAMLELHDLIQRDWSSFIALTSPSSYHMTLLGGVDAEQKAKKNWPTGIPETTSIPDTACSSEIGWLRDGSIFRKNRDGDRCRSVSCASGRGPVTSGQCGNGDRTL